MAISHVPHDWHGYHIRSTKSQSFQTHLVHRFVLKVTPNHNVPFEYRCPITISNKIMLICLIQIIWNFLLLFEHKEVILYQSWLWWDFFRYKYLWLCLGESKVFLLFPIIRMSSFDGSSQVLLCDSSQHNIIQLLSTVSF